MQHRARSLRKKTSSSGSSKANRRNAIAEYSYGYNMDNQESSNELASESRISRNSCDWEIFSDDETRTKRYEPLVNCLNSTVDSFVLDTISKRFSTKFILHEAISLGVPEDVLTLLADRFPEFITQVDDNGRYPVHVACAFGASTEFVSSCIHAAPLSVATKDINGKTPAHILCQVGWEGYWDTTANPAAEKNMLDILCIIYRKAPLSIASEDNRGVGCLEYAIESNLGIKFIVKLQEMIAHYQERGSRKQMSHLECMAARVSYRRSICIAPS